MRSTHAATGAAHPSENAWQQMASRSAHPSATTDVLGPGDLLGEIAAGIGAVTVPHGLTGSSPSSLTRDLVLRTPAYDVWVMHWPAGTTTDAHRHGGFVAFHVVDGAVIEDRPDAAGADRLHLRTGDTSVVPPFTEHRLVSLTPTTTVHVHAKELP